MNNEIKKPVYIVSLEAHFAKGIVAVRREFSKGLTIIGGDNGECKSSVLDVIAYLLGGGAWRPDMLQNLNFPDEKPYLNLLLSDGMVVERKGKSSGLIVKTEDGTKLRQGHLDSFISEFALNISAFMNASAIEKREYIIRALGDADKLKSIEAEEKVLVEKRKDANKEVIRADGVYKSKQTYADAPKELQERSVVKKEYDDAVDHNNKLKSDQALIDDAEIELNQKRSDHTNAENSIKLKKENIKTLQDEITTLEQDLADVEKSGKELKETINKQESELSLKKEIDLNEIDSKLKNIDAINLKVTANLEKKTSLDEFRSAEKLAGNLDLQVKAKRIEKNKIIEVSKLNLPDVVFEDDLLYYKGFSWDSMSGSQKLILSTAISKVLSPKMGFVLVDGLESLDIDSLNEYRDWLLSMGLQAITTRVSSGNECSFMIKDGRDVEVEEWQRLKAEDLERLKQDYVEEIKSQDPEEPEIISEEKSTPF